MDATFFAALVFLTAATALISWRRNPMFAGRPRLRLNLLAATGVATLAALAVYVVACTVDRSPSTLGITAAEAVIVGIAALMSLRLRAQARRQRNGRPARRKIEA